MKVHKRKKLSTKLLKGLFIFSLIIFICFSISITVHNYISNMNMFSETAFSYARSAAQFIDGDKVLKYLEPSGVDENGEQIYETDDYYNEVMKYLVTVQSQSPLMKYYYVFLPQEDTVTYIWDAYTADEPSLLGDTELYMDGGKEAVERIFNKEPIEKIAVFNNRKWGFIACAYYPIYNSEGEPVAVVGVDLSMNRIMMTLIIYIITILITTTLVTFVATSVYYFIITQFLIKPINQLNTATKKLVENLENNEKFSIEINTEDELEELAHSFGKMHSDLNEYLDRLAVVTAEKERIGAELKIAAQIQADMLPQIFPPFPERTEFDLYAMMEPAKEVGGDFYDFFMIDDDHIALVIADVSGKGVPAALFMVIAKTLIKNRAQMGGSPGEILEYVNNKLCEENEAELFVTVWLAIIEISTGKGVAANAGHEHPALCGKDGKFELVEYRHSPAVAVISGIMYKEHSFVLQPGSRLFVYTDGVAEANDKYDNRFGTDRMLASLNRNSQAPIKTLLHNVREDINAFSGDADQFDDITMMCFCYMKEK